VKLRPRVPRSPWTRSGIALTFLCGVGALLWWHGPNWADFREAFTRVDWKWVAVAVGLNLLSVVARAAAWNTVIHSAMPPPHPRFSLVFSAFSVGLLANAVLPGRVGELARVAVLTRRMDGRRQGLWPTLVGTVFAHRVFDLVPVGILVVWVLATAKIPGWAFTSLAIVLSIGVGLLFLGREGISFALLREMPGAATAEVPDSAQAPEEPPERERARARVPG
jgi:uncharacterized membrane protein YbhN (UPF0104 family)